MDCQHEWESSQSESLCAWCGSAGYILSEKTSLEKMTEELFTKKEKES